MIYNQEQPVVEEEWAGVKVKVNDKDRSVAKDQDVFFAKERYKLHQTMPDEGVSKEVLEKYFFKKYGF